MIRRLFIYFFFFSHGCGPWVIGSMAFVKIGNPGNIGRVWFM